MKGDLYSTVWLILIVFKMWSHAVPGDSTLITILGFSTLVIIIWGLRANVKQSLCSFYVFIIVTVPGKRPHVAQIMFFCIGVFSATIPKK